MRTLVSAAWLSLFALVLACGGGGGGGESQFADAVGPVVVTQTPAPGDPNVWARAPITLTFSAPVEPPAEDAVVLALDGGRVIPATARLSSDRKTLTIAPDALPPPRTEVTVVFREPIRARGGRTVTIPEWTYTVPQWQVLATPLEAGGDGDTLVELAAAPNGSVFLTMQFSLFGVTADLRSILEYGSDGRTELGTPVLPSGEHALYGWPIVVDGSGAPVMAYATDSGRIEVERRDGSGWTSLGSPTSALPYFPSVRLAVDSSGHPVIAWTGASGSSAIELARWSGTAWESLPHLTGMPSTSFDLAVGPNGTLGLALLNGQGLELAEFDGSQWTAMGTTVSADQVSATFDPDGLIAVCSSYAGPVRVYRAAHDFIGFRGLQEVGTSPSSTGHHVALRYRPTGAPDARLVLAFLEPTGPRVLGWDGQAWVSISEEIATPGQVPWHEVGVGHSLAVSSRGELVFAWAEVIGTYDLAYYVARYND